MSVNLLHSDDAPCASCNDLVRQSDLALECDICSCWFHLSCSGASTICYEKINECEGLPWICKTCKVSMKRVLSTVHQLEADNAALQSQLTELHIKLETLKSSVTPALSHQHPANTHAVSRPSKELWSKVVQKSSKRAREPSKAQHVDSGVTHPAQEADNNIANKARKGRSGPSSKRTVVDGARRIWGTLRSSTTTVIKRTMSQLISMENETGLRLRRKSQKMNNGKEKWWYVLHGEEDLLKSLDFMWEKVKLQTGWQLEHCTKPSEETHGSPVKQTDVVHTNKNSITINDVNSPETPNNSHTADSPEMSNNNSDATNTSHTTDSPGTTAVVANASCPEITEANQRTPTTNQGQQQLC